MVTGPSALDVLDSQLTADDSASYTKGLAALEQSLDSYWKFEVVPNQFKQSLAATDDLRFQYLDEHFGVIGSWDEVVDNLKTLNANAGANERYKILFLARHGQGYHNLAHAKYGNSAWNEYWLKKNGDGTIVWGPDPLLTDLGISQAQENRAQWKIEVLNNTARDPSLIVPKKWFVSPLSRSIDTLINTWDGVVDLQEVQPLIQENVRETIGVHTCDKRSPRSVIAQKYEKLGFRIEPGFEENDIYYKDDYRETVAEHALRINRNLQEIFTTTPEDIVSITSHSGSIRAQLLVLGHRSFAVGTGGMVPVFVKATKVGNA
ncbi:phosphoglycerate mutase [Suhomyces tanzawaensis NRRL Y-17324]|uniref:Phosphoglycerate mutase n=1 Tax=Suhomyces tanzawaensis NRRL Y-17324 TaxID=984487 RepID=A0A1E4SIM1_9ASCO|nr:phosphoglycerate mutase [Suhomyces tanzawaensis NRRL Y-17324]ODV79356.1 phosphoglycerate mutase [Suhomyces tanzawaensis NRRL Y-17324]